MSSLIKADLRSVRLVNRVAHISELCRAKRVLHLGATDAPFTHESILNGRLLHLHLRRVASHIVGLDNSVEMVELLKAECNVDDVLIGDIEQPADYPKAHFDVVVAGETFEHLSNPGRALEALRASVSPNAKLVITVPNAYSLKGFLRAVVGHELIHPDHVLHHSLRTLASLLSRHGFEVVETFGYVQGGTGLPAYIANRILHGFPQLAEGIGVICTPLAGDESIR